MFSTGTVAKRPFSCSDPFCSLQQDINQAMYTADREEVVHNALQKSSGLGQESEVELDDRSSNSERCSVSTPPTIDDAERSETLQELLLNDPATHRFMVYTGNYWPYGDTKDNIKWVHALYFMTVRVGLIVWFVLTVLFFAIDVVQDALAPATVGITVALAIISVLPAQYWNQQRLQQRAFQLDSSVAEESVKIATYFAGACFCTVIGSVIILCAGGQVASDLYLNIVLLSLVQILITSYLSFNLLFLMVDLKVSCILISQLLLLAEQKKLTILTFNHYRDDIHRRVEESKWTTDIIILPCVASVFCILILLFHGEKDLAVLTASWVIAMTKEFIFICVVFTYVANVNAQADTLRIKLSRNTWLPEVYLMNGDKVADSARGSEIIDELQRLTMCVSCFAQPISFTLLFKRVSWANVAMAGAGFVLSLILGAVIRSQVDRYE